jgi:transcriptional regulator
MESTAKLALIEAVEPEIAPFTDQVHSLMLESVSKIADEWIEQLKIVRDNTIVLENQIIACVDKTRADLKMLHDLGAKIADEAKRGQDVCKQLSDSIDKIALNA